MVAIWDEEDEAELVEGWLSADLRRNGERRQRHKLCTVTQQATTMKENYDGETGNKEWPKCYLGTQDRCTDGPEEI